MYFCAIFIQDGVLVMDMTTMHMLPAVLQLLAMLMLMVAIKQPTRAQVLLCTVGTIIGWGEMCFATFYDELPVHLTYIRAIYLLLVVLLMVTYVLYVRETTELEDRSLRRDLWWIIPVLVFLFFNVLVLVTLDGVEKEDFYQNIAFLQPTQLSAEQHSFYCWWTLWGYRGFVYSTTLAWAIEMVWAIFRKAKCHRMLRDYYTEEAITGRDLWGYFGTLITLTMLAMLLIGPFSALHQDSTLLSSLYLMCKYIILLLLIPMIYQMRFQMEDVEKMFEKHKMNAVAVTSSKMSASALPEEVKNKMEKVLKRIHDEKSYDKPGITLPDLAEQYGVSATYLREYIHSMGFSSFSDMVKKFREEG